MLKINFYSLLITLLFIFNYSQVLMPAQANSEMSLEEIHKRILEIINSSPKDTKLLEDLVKLRSKFINNNDSILPLDIIFKNLREFKMTDHEIFIEMLICTSIFLEYGAILTVDISNEQAIERSAECVNYIFNLTDDKLNLTFNILTKQINKIFDLLKTKKIKVQDLNRQDHIGMTPLMWATARGHEDLVIQLLKYQQDTSGLDKLKKLFYSKDHFELNLELTNSNDLSLLHLARKHNRHEVIKHIVKPFYDHIVAILTFMRLPTPIAYIICHYYK